MAKRRTTSQIDTTTLLGLGIGGIVLYYLWPQITGYAKAPAVLSQPRVLPGTQRPAAAPIGSRNQIAWVQENLNRILGSNLVVDGILGPLTKSAVITFQSLRGIAADGIPGPVTQAEINKALAGPVMVFAPEPE